MNENNKVNYVGNRGYNPYFNTFNPRWHEHPNLRWGRNLGVQNFHAPRPNPAYQLQQPYMPPQEAERKPTYNSDPSMPISVSKLEENLHTFNTETNLKWERKWHTKSITLRSGVVVKDPIWLEDSTHTPSVVDKVQEEVESEPAKRSIPFPSRLEERKKKENKKFLNFLNMFKTLNVNIPLLELLDKMPKYTKFLRDVISRRKKIGQGELNIMQWCPAMCL
ncbi:myb-like protein A [Gossypium australe]|uniref:Myb-like protein A n=1 Tax=Gossypium australe TaxID=47621 RepID=A0A5B6X110_9ROSI|nr:myb-like protein A [Gossypium australe]